MLMDLELRLDSVVAGLDFLIEEIVGSINFLFGFIGLCKGKRWSLNVLYSTLMRHQ